MFANGQPQHALPLPNKEEPGTWHGAAAATPDSGLITSGLAGIVLADVKLFSGAMTAKQLATLTASPVPAPAPKPLPPPKPPHHAPPGPRHHPPVSGERRQGTSGAVGLSGLRARALVRYLRVRGHIIGHARNTM